MRIRPIVAVLLMTVLPVLASAAELNVPADFATIQGAIDAAVDGDSVVVAAGTYSETIDFLGKSITVVGAAGAEMTTIDGSGVLASVVAFTSGEGANAILDGFTIQGGSGVVGSPVQDRAGGGLYGFGASPTLRNLRVVGNTASGRGGGAFFWGVSGTLAIESCQFEDNVAGGGAGLWVEGSGACVVTDSSISDNSSTGGLAGLVAPIASFSMTDSELSRNATTDENLAYAGGMWLGNPLTYGNQNTVATFLRTELDENFCSFAGGCFVALRADVSFEECTFRGNVANAHAVGLVDFSTVHFERCLIAGNLVPSTVTGLVGVSINGFGVTFDQCTITENTGEPLLSGPGLVIRNSIVWNNESTVVSSGTGFEATVDYSTVAGGHPGVGNLEVDPLFLAPASGDFRLSSASPCIDAGDPAAGTDPDGTNIEMGAFYFDQTVAMFGRGDTNVDGQLDIGDGIAVLSGLFGSYVILCESAADANDDGIVTIADAVYLFSYQLLDGPPPPAPGSCDSDPTPDALDCLQGC
ncbi:MAG: right-handed parallel beta-helix repeat-containing protein [Planctomycetota bacterium]